MYALESRGFISPDAFVKVWRLVKTFPVGLTEPA